MHIGVLALQGDIQAHEKVLARLGVCARPVRAARALDGLQGLVLPGGESTTMWHFLRQDGFADRLRDFARAGGALFGTCAGAIVLAREIENPTAVGLGILDMAVQRNGYGRQARSRIDRAVTDVPGPALEVVLIRAPRILRTGPGVRVLARLHGEPIWVEAGRVMATTFHPELSDELRAHRRFLDLAAGARAFPCVQTAIRHDHLFCRRNLGALIRGSTDSDPSSHLTFDRSSRRGVAFSLQRKRRLA